MFSVRTKSLLSILDEAKAPRTIEYLSLDIEGAELYVMEHFPFDTYTFLVITVERPRRLEQKHVYHLNINTLFSSVTDT